MKKRLRFFKSIQFKIPILFILLLVMALQLIGVNFMSQLESQLITNFREQIQQQTDFLVSTIQPILSSSELSTTQKRTQVQTVMDGYPTGTNIIEVRVVDAEGTIVATTSQSNQGLIGTKSTDRDVQKVLVEGSAINYTYMDGETRYWKYVTSISSTSTTDAIGSISVVSNIESRYQQLQNIGIIFLNASLVALCIVVLVSFFISQGITRPIAEMKKQAEQIATGVYTGIVTIYGEDELGQLGEAINDLSTKVKEAQDASESERQRLDSVLRHMSDGVIATDRRGRITMANVSSLNMLNVELGEIIGKPIIRVLELDSQWTLRDLLYTQNENTIQIERDESIISCEFSVIQRESSFISGLVCVLTDETEREQIEAERRNFVSNVSHELRTPLTSISSYTEALIDGAWESPDVAPQFLKVIETETNRMLRMITDLLNLSRMDQMKLELNKEFINMNALLEHIVNRFEMVIQNNELYRHKNYRILKDITNRDIWVEIDPDKMTQVVDNILNNAIKYSPNGGRIIVRLMDTHNEMIISISDEGLGIPRKALTHVFERFYRVDKARSRQMGGSGLGLAISKEVVQLHGGRIWATSQEGKGSTFYVSLPYESFEEDGDWA